MRLVCAGVLLLAGCDLFDPCAGPEHLSFAVVHRGILPDGTSTVGAQAPRWGATETMKPSDTIEIIFPEQDALPSDVLELYGADGARLAFAADDLFVPTDVEACAHNERHFALDALTAGDYTLVHRRKNGTGDPLNCGDAGCPWTMFDGDEAVTLTLAIR